MKLQVVFAGLSAVGGIVDIFPNLPNIDRWFGINIHLYPYCDSFTYKNKTIGIHGEKGADFCLTMLTWSKDIIWFADKKVYEEEREKLEKFDIQIIEDKVIDLIGDDKLKFVEVSNNKIWYEIDALFLSLKYGQEQRSHLPQQLGLKIEKDGGIKHIDTETDISGLFACGDANNKSLVASVAGGEGVMAAVKCNKYLTELDYHR